MATKSMDPASHSSSAQTVHSVLKAVKPQLHSHAACDIPSPHVRYTDGQANSAGAFSQTVGDEWILEGQSLGGGRPRFE
jgi:hypothetical protein